MDRLKEMQTFTAVVDAGSFVKAAEILGMSKAAVSRYVADLEARLGVRLLHRTTRKLSLTEEGSVFNLRCRELLSGVEEAEAEDVELPEALRAAIAQSRQRIAERHGEDSDLVIADSRYTHAHALARAASRQTRAHGRTLSDRIDTLVNHMIDDGPGGRAQSYAKQAEYHALPGYGPSRGKQHTHQRRE